MVSTSAHPPRVFKADQDRALVVLLTAASRCLQRPARPGGRGTARRGDTDAGRGTRPGGRGALEAGGDTDSGRRTGPGQDPGEWRGLEAGAEISHLDQSARRWLRRGYASIRNMGAQPRRARRTGFGRCSPVAVINASTSISSRTDASWLNTHGAPVVADLPLALALAGGMIGNHPVRSL